MKETGKEPSNWSEYYDQLDKKREARISSQFNGSNALEAGLDALLSILSAQNVNRSSGDVLRGIGLDNRNLQESTKDDLRRADQSTAGRAANTAREALQWRQGENLLHQEEQRQRELKAQIAENSLAQQAQRRAQSLAYQKERDEQSDAQDAAVARLQKEQEAKAAAQKEAQRRAQELKAAQQAEAKAALEAQRAKEKAQKEAERAAAKAAKEAEKANKSKRSASRKSSSRKTKENSEDTASLLEHAPVFGELPQSTDERALQLAQQSLARKGETYRKLLYALTQNGTRKLNPAELASVQRRAMADGAGHAFLDWIVKVARGE